MKKRDSKFDKDVVTLRMNKQIREELQTVAERQGRVMSELIREAVAYWLEEYRKKTTRTA